jgi:hypothetical protein
MIRAAASLLFATALLLLVAPGCSKSSDNAINPKVEMKDKTPPVQTPGGVPGAKGKKTGPAPGSQ